MKLIPWLIAVLLACACASSSSSSTAQSSPTPSPSPSPSPQPTVSAPANETPVARQVLPPATDLPSGSLCSAPLQTTADGNAKPLLCSTGAVNVLAWKFYAGISASVLGLGLNPTQGQAEGAICDDINHNHATRPEEASGYQLAAAYYGWNFPIDPAKVSCS